MDPSRFLLGYQFLRLMQRLAFEKTEHFSCSFRRRIRSQHRPLSPRTGDTALLQSSIVEALTDIFGEFLYERSTVERLTDRIERVAE